MDTQEVWEDHVDGGEITKGQIAYVPLDPVTNYVHILDLNTRIRVG